MHLHPCVTSVTMCCGPHLVQRVLSVITARYWVTMLTCCGDYVDPVIMTWRQKWSRQCTVIKYRPPWWHSVGMDDGHNVLCLMEVWSVLLSGHEAWFFFTSSDAYEWLPRPPTSRISSLTIRFTALEYTQAKCQTGGKHCLIKLHKTKDKNWKLNTLTIHRGWGILGWGGGGGDWVKGLRLGWWWWSL